jgi:hypothetical protein
VNANQTPGSDFHIHGFLGLTSDANAVDFWNENSDWHELVLNLHSLALAAFQKVQVSNRDPQRILAYTLFYRLLTAYQAVALLSARGMDVEAKAMLRMMSEAIIVLVATCKDPSFAVRFIKADEDIRRQLLKSTLEAETKPEPGQKLFVTPLQIEQMKAELAELEHRWTNKILVKKIEIKEIATEAGLLALYRKHFAFFSLFAHLAPSGMRQFLVTNEKGDITHFRTGVFYDDALANVRSAIAFVMMGLSATNDLLSLAVQPALDGINQRMEALITRIETAAERNG